MLSMREVHEKGKPGDVLGCSVWQYWVTVTIKEILPDRVVVEGEDLVSSPYAYLLENHPDNWKTWEFRK